MRQLFEALFLCAKVYFVKFENIFLKMKKVKKIVWFVLGFVLLLVLGVYGYLLSTKPKYEGELQLTQLDQKVEVYFDDYGVPHIYAQSEKDAMRALGFVHAQDRLWQMELLRRIAPGRLSELFGTKTIEVDKLFKGLGIDQNSTQAIAELDKNGKPYQLAMAYLDGINQYIDQGKTPIEFTLLGLKKKKFTIKDVYNIFGYMSFSFAMAQKTDPLLTNLKGKLGDDYLRDLGLDLSYNTTKIKTTPQQNEQYVEIATAVADLLESSPVPPFVGSNSWVLSSKKTATGKVLFSNDPHIEYSQPGTWYEAHICCPEFEIYGYYLAGTPYPLLGHNRKYAYGLTMFENDDADFYQETTNPSNANQYKTASGYQTYKVRNTTITVKDSASITLQIKETSHGPVMNGILKDFNPKQPVAFHWVYTHEKNRILDAVYQLSHAKNLSDFQQGISYIAAPGLNVMYGDAQNNIAWKTSGKLYKFQKSVNPNFILNGSNGIDDQVTPIDFSKNPGATNPSWNYVYSSNNMPEDIDGYLYPGYYLPEDRARRISGLLEAKSNWTKEDISKMLVDNTSPVNVEVTQNFIHSIAKEKLSANEQIALQLLSVWKGTNDKKEVAPTIYNKLVFFYLKNTFEDEMGEVGFKQFLKTHCMKQSIANQSKKENSPWWDNIATKGVKETRSAVLTKSFHEAISSLTAQLGSDVNSWTWNRVHKVEFKHPLGSVAVLQPFFNVGIFEISGANEVINNVMYEYTDDEQYAVKAGPSTRRIVDFSDVENSWSILPTGQSGNPMSAHYNDQAQMYVDGKFRKMKLNQKEIVATSTKLTLLPSK